MADDRERARSITMAIFACRDADCPMPFALYREQDVTGVSGEGTVAHGTQFADGTVVLRWLGKDPSTVVWASLEAAMRVHGHDGRTRVVWLAAPFSEMGLAEREAAVAERERLAAVIPPERFRSLADWFDADDEFKVTMFPETWPSRSHELQDDLRKFAGLLGGEETTHDA